MPTEQEQLEHAIAVLDEQRAVLGDATVELAAAPLRARLQSLTATPAQRLKQLTIVFLDVVGSTDLSQRLDPEEIHVIMDGALARCASVVARHHGRVLQYAGDSLLAAFGADAAGEDDAERAVRCGLDLLELGRELGAAVHAAHGHAGFDFRIGIHTGGVLLGGGVDGEASIRGMAVNIAARMEQAAPAGGLRISHDTYCQVRGVFDVQPQPLLPVKGVDAPMRSYLVLRSRPRAFHMATRGIEGIETRLVGRDRELRQLHQALADVRATQCRAAVVIVAEAGLGKSRLVHEFRSGLQALTEYCDVLPGRAYPQTRGQPYAMLRDVLARRLEITDDDDVDSALRKFEQAFAPLSDTAEAAEMAQAHAHLLGHLVGLDLSASPHLRGILDDSRQIRDRGFHAAAQLLRRMNGAIGGPTVLLMEDLHWADDGSLDFLAYLLSSGDEMPMLLIATARASLFEHRPGWPGPADAHSIVLGPLPPSDSDALVDELLQKLPEVPPVLRAHLTQSAEGNPFFMEELVKTLIDDGAIRVGDGAWSLRREPLRMNPVPPTLTGVLQARLDGLPAGERMALQQASVVGFVFWDGALASIDATAPAALPALVRRELIVRHAGATLEAAREFAFRHHLLHRVTYDTLLKRFKREWHSRAARWLAALRGVRANDYLAATAEHYEKGGEPRQACDFYLRAAEHAASRFANDVALDYLARALALADSDDDELRWRLLDLRERTLDLLGRRGEQQADITELSRLADRLGDGHRHAEAALRASGYALRTNDFQACAAAARQALDRATRSSAVELELRARQRLALALLNLGDAAGAKSLAHAGLEVARRQRLLPLEGLFLSSLAVAADRKQDAMEALRLQQQVLPIDRALGNRRSEARTLLNLGISWLYLGRFAEAGNIYKPHFD